jgi:DNA topoisomerase I
MPGRRRRKPKPPEIVTDPLESAKAAGLRYVTDGSPGIRRRRVGKSFTYLDPQGRRLQDSDILRRIRALAIPPAWTAVWICASPNGHIQAVGRDARARKQYRYHARWRQVRDETKYSRMLTFAAALPRIRQRVDEDLQRAGLPRDKVLATVLRLLETTLIRVGNEEYARENGSFGLTTMRRRHVGSRQSIDSADVNEYLRGIAGEEFTAKDFRTWAGTVLAALALRKVAAFESTAHAKRNITRAIESVARQLGNTPAICRKGYVHPAVIDAYLDGVTVTVLKRRTTLNALEPGEAMVLRLLQQRLLHQAKETKQKAA